MVWVTKASGKIEKFNVNKVKRTCLRAGATRDLAESISKRVEQRIKNGMTTQDILEITLSMLRREMPGVAMRYDLKGALLRLGPSGFSFEELIASVLREFDYKAKVHTMIKGGSGIMHEIDVLASKPIKIPSGMDLPKIKYYVIECKYHASPGIYTGVKDVLYTHARFLDLQDASKKGIAQKFDQSWLATNTKFSDDVIKYAEAKSIKLLSWDYPKGNSLRDMMDQKKLYPITVLHQLDTNTQGKLAQAGVVLINTIINTPIEKLSDDTGISIRIIKMLKEEAEKTIR